MTIRTERHNIIQSEDPAALADSVDAVQRSTRVIFNNTTECIHTTGRLPKKFDLFKKATEWRREGKVGQAPVVVQRGAALQALFSCAKHFAHVRQVSDRLLWGLAADEVAVAWLATLPDGCDAPEGRKALKAWLKTLSEGDAPAKQQRSAVPHKPLKRFRAPRETKDFMRSRNRHEAGQDRPGLFFVGGVRRLEARLLHLPGFGAVIVKGCIDKDAVIVSAHLVERTKHPQGRKGRKRPQSARRFAVHLRIREPDPPAKPIAPETAGGVDVGIVNAASTSDGRLLHLPDESELQDRIVAAQQRRAQRTPYSVAWRKDLALERRLRRGIAGRRLNAVRHLALMLAQSASVLAVEDFKAQNCCAGAGHGFRAGSKRQGQKNSEPAAGMVVRRRSPRAAGARRLVRCVQATRRWRCRWAIQSACGPKLPGASRRTARSPGVVPDEKAWCKGLSPPSRPLGLAGWS